jgi:Zn finger protein HypA/HybF involved in hydrogenase expression
VSKITSKYNLQISDPILAKEWHPTKNGKLTPRDVTQGSRKKVWWQCSKGHEWPATVANRSIGKGCSYCCGKKVGHDNCLQRINPTLSKEWHPTKNGSLTPKDVTEFSHKKVWWKCLRGHEWPAIVANRSKGRGCPYCGGKKVNDENCLQTVKPALAKEWHPTKNGNLTSRDVTVYSNRKVWWRCSKSHEWQTTVAARSSGRNCPYCGGKKVSSDNCLQMINPTLAKEWHPTKNGSLTPKGVTIGSIKKVWWLCSRGHEWTSTVNNRSYGQGCPNCHSQTSQLELKVFTEMKFLFHDAEHRKKIHGAECDVFVPSLNLAIEIDGAYYHKDKYEQDKIKTNILKKSNVDLIRIREKGLSKVSSHDILCKTTKIDFSVFHSLIKQILLLKPNIGYDVKNRIKNYLTKAEFANNEEFLKLWDMLPSPFPEMSLQAINPSMAKEWHPTKNGKLTPRDVAPFSNKRVWWLCSMGHEWPAKVANRSYGDICPYCGGKKVSSDNCLQMINPTLAKEWHPTKNGKLTPRDVTQGVGKKVWWLCSMGHEWTSTVNNRSKGNGCPYCAGQKVTAESCLQRINPTLSKEWHPTKNGSLTPKDVTEFSHKKVWWLCSKGHEFEATVSHRSNGSGCPYCYRQRRGRL